MTTTAARTVSRSNDPTKPDYVDPTVEEMHSRWKLINAIRAGSAGMRGICHDVLPQEPAEQDAWYSLRVQNSELIPLMQEALRKLAAMPFAELVGHDTEGGEDVSEVIKAHLKDVDGTGCSVTAFLYNVLHESLWYGLQPVLVDVDGEVIVEPSPLEAAEAVQRGEQRAVWKLIPPTSLLRLRYTRDKGTLVVSRIAWMEHDTEEDGDFGVKSIQRIFDLSRESLEVYERTLDPDGTGSTDWETASDKSRSRGGKPVPVKIFHPELLPEDSPEKRASAAIGPHLQAFNLQDSVAGLPFGGMAELQRLHFRRYADYGELQRFNIPTRVTSGYQESDDEHNDWTVSVHTHIRLGNPQAKTSYLQADASSLQVRGEELDRIGTWIQIAGLEPLVQQSVDKTATEVSSDERRTLSRSASWVRKEESFARELLDMTAEALSGFEVPETFAFQIAANLDLPTDVIERAKVYIELAKLGKLNGEELLKAIKALGFWGTDFDPEAVAQIAMEEAEELEPDPPPIFGGDPAGAGAPPGVPAGDEAEEEEEEPEPAAAS